MVTLTCRVGLTELLVQFTLWNFDTVAVIQMKMELIKRLVIVRIVSNKIFIRSFISY